MTDAPVSQPDQPDVDEIWLLFERKFSNLRGMRPGPGNLLGVSDRTHASRLSGLEQSKIARFVRDKTKALTDVELGLLMTKAAISHEQAASALRLTLVANVSIPLGGLIALSQLMPDTAEMVRDFLAEGGVSLEILLLSVAILVLIALWYSYAGVAQSRDLLHLLRIEMARRGEADDTAQDLDFDMPIGAADEVPGANGISV